MCSNRTAAKNRKSVKKRGGGEAGGAGANLLKAAAVEPEPVVHCQTRRGSEARDARSRMQGGDEVEWHQGVIRVNGAAGGGEGGYSGIGATTADLKCLAFPRGGISADENASAEIPPSVDEVLCDDDEMQLLLELLAPCPQPSVAPALAKRQRVSFHPQKLLQK